MHRSGSRFLPNINPKDLRHFSLGIVPPRYSGRSGQAFNPGRCPSVSVSPAALQRTFRYNIWFQVGVASRLLGRFDIFATRRKHRNFLAEL